MMRYSQWIKGNARLLLLVVILYCLVKMIVNSEPFIAIGEHGVSIGIFNFYKQVSIQQNDIYFAIQPLWKISAFSTDIAGASALPPGSIDVHGISHFLGTDRLGRDILAGFISGFEIAVILSVLVGMLSSFLSLFFGSMSTYFSYRPIRLSRTFYTAIYGLFILDLIFLFWWILGITNGMYFILSGIASISLLFYANYSPLNPKKNYKSLNLGFFSIRVLEFVQPIPDVLLIIILSSLFSGMGLVGLIIIFVLLRLPSGSYYFSNLLKPMMQSDFVKYAKTSGMNGWRMIWSHILPQGKHMIATLAAMAGIRAVLSESTLSFLGLGPTSNYITWGNMIAAGLQQEGLWWMVVIPVLGLVIWMTILQQLIKPLQSQIPSNKAN